MSLLPLLTVLKIPPQNASFKSSGQSRIRDDQWQNDFPKWLSDLALPDVGAIGPS